MTSSKTIPLENRVPPATDTPRNLGKYARLLGLFYRTTLATEMEYRFNFLSNIFNSAFWVVWAALSVRVYFSVTDSILGWSYFEVVIVMGMFFTINGIRQMIMEPNLNRLSEYIRMGTLDYILTKPINSQFMVSLRNIGVFNWIDPVLGLGLVTYALVQLHYTPTFAQVLLLIGLVKM